ncbi:unnamed protein product [Strongylus vulgaris]|uniref:Uncharacterized protein n=1 Tax=Strongylus vulgaris TaxID=40348 RepID=A0A3P7KC12_STRVU|nr:unnamed protein product [Strongylus vulgaris]
MGWLLAWMFKLTPARSRTITAPEHEKDDTSMRKTTNTAEQEKGEFLGSRRAGAESKKMKNAKSARAEIKAVSEYSSSIADRRDDRYYAYLGKKI